jgi:hypothetical protein
MALQLIQASGTKRVDAGVVPDVRPRAAMAAELNVVEMGCRTDTVDAVKEHVPKGAAAP